MSRGIHDILEYRTKNGMYGTTSIIKAFISYTGFTLSQSKEYDDAITEFAAEMDRIIRLFPVPTLNPFVDYLDKYDTKGVECLKHYIQDNMEVISQKQVDNYRDAVKIQAPFDLVLVNIIPFLDSKNKSLTIESGEVQTLFFKHVLKGNKDE